MSTLDPDTWGDIIGTDTANERILNTILGTTPDHKTQAYIDENLREKLPVSEIAKALSVSVSTLNRCAEKNVNMAIGKFILQKRIMLACKYLKDPKYNISEIAGNCGITDYNYFSRVFKLKTGMTPREYRTVFLRSGKVPELPDPDKLTLSQVTLSGGEQQ